MEYSDEPFGSALGAMGEHGGGGDVPERLKYSFENEWRIVRLLKRLEDIGGGVSVSPFDPASVCRVIIRPTASVEAELRRCIASDERYTHVQLEVQEPGPSDSVTV